MGGETIVFLAFFHKKKKKCWFIYLKIPKPTKFVAIKNEITIQVCHILQKIFQNVHVILKMHARPMNKVKQIIASTQKYLQSELLRRV